MSAERDWKNDSPTEKQLNYLRSVFIDVRHIKTKGEASAIIDDLSRGTPISLEEFLSLRPQLRSKRSPDDMHMAAQHWQDKFGEFGYLSTDFKKPIQRHIRQVVESLDGTDPGWDMTGPDRFSVPWSRQLEDEADYKFLSILGQLFPELRKTARRAPARGVPKAAVQNPQKSGCVVLLCPIVFLLVLWFRH